MSCEFTIDLLDKADYNKVFDFMQEKFRVQEPITSALNTTANDSYVFYKDLCSFGFKTEKTSLVVRNSENEIIGVALNGIYDYNELPKNEPQNKLDFTNEIQNGPYPTRNANRLVIFIDHIESGFFKFVSPMSKIFKCDILCVRQDYYGKGIGTKLIQKSIELARQQFNSQYCATCATAKASQALFERNGFKTVREVNFSDFLDNNDPVYLKVPDGGKRAKLMLLTL